MMVTLCLEVEAERSNELLVALAGRRARELRRSLPIWALRDAGHELVGGDQAAVHEAWNATEVAHALERAVDGGDGEVPVRFA